MLNINDVPEYEMNEKGETQTEEVGSLAEQTRQGQMDATYESQWSQHGISGSPERNTVLQYHPCV